MNQKWWIALIAAVAAVISSVCTNYVNSQSVMSAPAVAQAKVLS